MKKTLFTLLSAILLVLASFSESNAQKKPFFGQVPPVRTNQNGVIINNPNAPNRQGRWNTTRNRNTNNKGWQKRDDDRDNDRNDDRDDDRNDQKKQNKKYYKSDNGKHKGWYKNNNGNGHRRNS